MVDGGVLNNTPVHIAIDAGATHVISLELEPLGLVGPLAEPGQTAAASLLEAGLGTVQTLLALATEEDVRGAVAWNRFLAQNRELLSHEGCETAVPDDAACARKGKRLVPLYRIAPEERLVSTLEFDGRFEGTRLATSLRDWLRRGKVDAERSAWWRATVQPDPGPRWRSAAESAG